MNGTLVSIGRAPCQVVGLNPQRVGSQSAGRVPGRPTFTGMDYQLTGLDEKITAISAVTWPHVTGGLDTLGWLQAQHDGQDVVNLIRLGANWFGQLAGTVVIRSLDIDEGRFHPFTGAGRKVEVDIELVHVGPGINAAGLAGRFFGGISNAL